MDIILDLRFAIRGLLRSPGFAIVSIVTIALGIGANAAIFSVVNAIVLRPLPYPNADRLVDPMPDHSFSAEVLEHFQQGLQTFEHLAGYRRQLFTIIGGGGRGEPEVITGEVVSWSYFNALGVSPEIGRSFVEAEGQFGGEPVVVLSYQLWQRRFGGDHAILNRMIELDGEGAPRRTVVGVMPEGFRPMTRNSMAWVPLAVDPSNEEAYSHYANLNKIGFLRDEVTLSLASADVRRVAQTLTDMDFDVYTDEVIASAHVVTLKESIVGDVRPITLLILGAVGIVLLIACLNVTNLLLARGRSRESEIAVRSALGAGRWRIMRQLLTESIVLGVMGGVLGLLVASWVVGGFSQILPDSIPRREEIKLDHIVLLYTFMISVFAGGLFGIIPALKSVQPVGQGSLHMNSRSATLGRHQYRLNNGFIALELAFSVVLIIGAGLLLKSFWQIQQVDVGFNPDRLLAARLTPPSVRVANRDQAIAYYREVVEAVEAMPQVTSAAVSSFLPLDGPNAALSYATLESIPEPGQPVDWANYRTTSPGYFSTMGIPLRDGRDFNLNDNSESNSVVIVNAALAGKHWPGESAVGRELVSTKGEPWATIVGVVGDVRHTRVEREPDPTIYFPYGQDTSFRSLYIVVQTEVEPVALMPTARAAIWSVDPEVPIRKMQTMAEVIRLSVSDSRFYTILFSSFAGLALLLGAAGVYGVMTYTIAQQTTSIGIRMTLGATGRRIMCGTILRGMLPVMIGVVIGEIGAWGLSRFLSNLLYEVQPTDLVVFMVVALFLGLVALVAAYIPVRRATRIEPLAALRCE